MQAQRTKNAFLINLLALENRIQQVEVEEMKNKIFKGLNKKKSQRVLRKQTQEGISNSFTISWDFHQALKQSCSSVIIVSRIGCYCRLGIKVSCKQFLWFWNGWNRWAEKYQRHYSKNMSHQREHKIEQRGRECCSEKVFNLKLRSQNNVGWEEKEISEQFCPTAGSLCISIFSRTDLANLP